MIMVNLDIDFDLNFVIIMKDSLIIKSMYVEGVRICIRMYGWNVMCGVLLNVNIHRIVLLI